MFTDIDPAAFWFGFSTAGAIFIIAAVVIAIQVRRERRQRDRFSGPYWK